MTTNPTLNPNWLGYFRIQVAVFALVHFLAIQPDFNRLYADQSAYIYPDILDATHDHIGFTLTSLLQAGQQLGLSLSYEALLMSFRLAYPLFLLALALGLFTRLSAVGALFLQITLTQSIHLFEYGVDAYTTIALFYCSLFPVGRSLALGRLRTSPPPPDAGRFYLLVLQLHLGIAYFFSGLDKVIGETWRNGEAIWKALHSHNYGSFVSLDGLANTPFFWLMGWATVGLELAYLPLTLHARTRPWALAGMLSLHIGIGLWLGLYFFSALMILLNLSAFYAPYVPAFLRLPPSKTAAAAGTGPFRPLPVGQG